MPTLLRTLARGNESVPRSVLTKCAGWIRLINLYGAGQGYVLALPRAASRPELEGSAKIRNRGIEVHGAPGLFPAQRRLSQAKSQE